MQHTALTEENPLPHQVMIVDDTEVIRCAIADLFAQVGIQVLAAQSGEECLAMLRQGFRGVILMDVMMPGMDGWQTIRAIDRASLTEGNLIVMLTALDAPDERMEGLQNLVIDYFTKPIVPDELIRSVRTYLTYLDNARDGSVVL